MATEKQNETATDAPKTLRERFSERYGRRATSKCRERMILDGHRRVVIYGCRKILIYSPTEIRLLLAKEELCVLGERLYCSSFSAGCVTVDGTIGGILYGKLRKMIANGEKR